MLTKLNIAMRLLKSEVETNYALQVKEIRFIPGGEASWGYLIETHSEKYFFKIYKGLTQYKTRFNLTYRLYNDARISHITHPIETINGNLVLTVEKYPAALFNFISGHTGNEKDLNMIERIKLGELLGRIHQSNKIIGDYSIKEDFTYDNTTRLVNSVRNRKFPISSEYVAQLQKLLQEYEETVLSSADKLIKLGNILRNQKLDFVICHGEPHKWNTMVTKSHEVFLIDWDDSLYAPKEKDLNMVKDDLLVLEGYRSVCGEFSLDPEIIEYYSLEWYISSIDAWVNSLLSEKVSDVQNKHFIEELTSDLQMLQYLVR